MTTRICPSDCAQRIKESIPMEQAARFYGFTPNRSGYIKCPFHHEKTASLKLYPETFYCFGCHKGGSVIDFVMELYGLSFRDAATRLDADFNLGLTDVSVTDRQASRKDAMARRRQQIREQARKAAAEREYYQKCREYQRLHDYVKHNEPDIDGEITTEFANAIKRMNELDYWFETHER